MYNVKDEELELAMNIIRIGSFIISVILMVTGAVQCVRSRMRDQKERKQIKEAKRKMKMRIKQLKNRQTAESMLVQG